jgi:hypothetical protein
MIRSFVVGFVTILVVVLFGARDYIAAQQKAGAASGPASVPVQFTGGTGGVNLELFLNAGKVADVTINSSGTGASVLDLSNLGKVQLQVYVDVCQDGKTVRVLVVAGQPTPEGNCKRRIVGAAWWSDCGVTRITIDLTKFGMRVIGCGSFFSENKKWIIPVGAGVATTPFFFGGGGSSTTTSTSVSTPTTTAVAPTPTPTPAPTTGTPPAVSPTPTPTPFVPPVVSTFNYAVNMTSTGVNHTSPGNFSDLCFEFLTDPAQTNQAFTATTTGPGVSQPSVTGTTDSTGRGSGNVRIVQFGPYTIVITMNVQGLQKSATGTFTVNSAGVPCVRR